MPFAKVISPNPTPEAPPDSRTSSTKPASCPIQTALFSMRPRRPAAGVRSSTSTTAIAISTRAPIRAIISNPRSRPRRGRRCLPRVWLEGTSARKRTASWTSSCSSLRRCGISSRAAASRRSTTCFSAMRPASMGAGKGKMLESREELEKREAELQRDIRSFKRLLEEIKLSEKSRHVLGWRIKDAQNSLECIQFRLQSMDTKAASPAKSQDKTG